METKTAEKHRKVERTTQEQLARFLQFCKEHPELQTGKNCPTAPRTVQNLWEQVAGDLNAIRGPTRTAAKWKESLSHWKNQLRARSRKAKVQNDATGGGPRTPDISEFEQQTVCVFGAAAVDGLRGVESMGHADDGQQTVVPGDDSTMTQMCVDLSPLEVVVEEQTLCELPPSPATPATPRNTKKVSMETVYNAAMESIKARGENEERSQQANRKHLAGVLKEIAQNQQATQLQLVFVTSSKVFGNFMTLLLVATISAEMWFSVRETDAWLIEIW